VHKANPCCTPLLHLLESCRLFLPSRRGHQNRDRPWNGVMITILYAIGTNQVVLPIHPFYHPCFHLGCASLIWMPPVGVVMPSWTMAIDIIIACPNHLLRHSQKIGTIYFPHWICRNGSEGVKMTPSRKQRSPFLRHRDRRQYPTACLFLRSVHYPSILLLFQMAHPISSLRILLPIIPLKQYLYHHRRCVLSFHSITMSAVFVERCLCFDVRLCLANIALVYCSFCHRTKTYQQMSRVRAVVLPRPKLPCR
jgi:hypothetical protein